MKINKTELQKALEIVKPGLANKEIIEQSTTFAFMGDRVVTYNDEISISHPVKGLNLTAAIPAQELYQLLRKTKEKEFELFFEGSEIRLISGRDKAGFAISQEITLPLNEFTLPKKWEKIPDNLLAGIKFCSFSCSRDMSRPILTCVHIREDGIIEASDGYRITQYKTAKLPVNTLLIPASSTQHLVNMDVIEMAEGDGWGHFRTKEGTVFSCRVFADNYPDTSSLFEVEGEALEFPKNLGEILDKANVFAKQDFALDQKTEITIAENKMIVRTENAMGWFEAEANIRYKGDPITLIINPQFLQEIAEKELSCVVGKTVLKFEGKNWKHVVALFVPRGTE